MTEVETVAILQDELRALRDHLAVIEERSSTPMPVPTPELRDSNTTVPPPPPPIPLLFEESKLAEPLTFDGKASIFLSFLQQYKRYIRIKLITFRKHDDEFRIAFFISHLYDVPTE